MGESVFSVRDKCTLRAPSPAFLEMEKHDLGRSGEELATEHLTGLGWEILARNWRAGRKEVDIIARDGSQIVFIEVKTRRSRRFGDPVEFVDPAKCGHLVHAATHWMAENGWEGEIRFDIIGLVGNRTPTLTHHRDVFFPQF